MATLEARAVNDLAHVEVDTVVNQQRLQRMFYALDGRDRDLLHLHACSPPRASSTRRAARSWPTCRGPPTPSCSTSSRETIPQLSKVVAGEQVTFLGRCQRRASAQGLAPLQRRRRQVFRRQRACCPDRHSADPWQITLTERPAEHGVLPDRRRRRVEALPARCPARADDHIDCGRPCVPARTPRSRPGSTSTAATSRRSKGPR